MVLNIEDRSDCLELLDQYFKAADFLNNLNETTAIPKGLFPSLIAICRVGIKTEIAGISYYWQSTRDDQLACKLSSCLNAEYAELVEAINNL